MQAQQCAAFLGPQTLQGSEQKMIKGSITNNNIRKWHRGIRVSKKIKVHNELKTEKTEQ